MIPRPPPSHKDEVSVACRPFLPHVLSFPRTTSYHVAAGAPQRGLHPVSLTHPLGAQALLSIRVCPAYVFSQDITAARACSLPPSLLRSPTGTTGLSLPLAPSPPPPPRLSRPENKNKTTAAASSSFSFCLLPNRGYGASEFRIGRRNKYGKNKISLLRLPESVL